MVTSHAAALIVPFKCSRNTNIFLVFRSAHFYNFVKSMLVRNPKKRPSASKMLSVSCFNHFYRVFRLMCVKRIKDSSFHVLLHVLRSTCFSRSSAWTGSWPWIYWRNFIILRRSELAWWQRTKTWRSIGVIPPQCINSLLWVILPPLKQPFIIIIICLVPGSRWWLLNL